MSQKNKNNVWTFIMPVSGVDLTKYVNNELKIKRVLLVSKKKLPFIRKRLGISRKISELKNSTFGEPYTFILNSSETIAIVRETGESESVINKCRKIIQDELSILSASQLGWSKRRFNASIKPQISNGGESFYFILLNNFNEKGKFSSEVADKLVALSLDGRWKDSAKRNFFKNLLKVINKEVKVNAEWREAIERSAILIGQSQNSGDIAHAFLYNMIALEILLTRQGDKYKEVLPKRISAFLGWIGFWETNSYPEKINEVYLKRCVFVHDGKREKITIPDLLFTDDILFNILTNILGHSKLFKSKDDVIDFAKKVEAEQLLGIKPKVQPKTLKFISRTYTQKDFEKI